MMARIRPAQDTDCDAVLALIAELARDDRGADVDEGAVTAAIRSCISGSDRTIFIAEGDTGLIGYIAVHWVPFPMLGGTEGYISDLIVARARRGEGVGRRLVAAAEDRARELGCVRLMLNNRVAAESYKRAFYPKLGFRIRDEFANLVKSLR